MTDVASSHRYARMIFVMHHVFAIVNNSPADHNDRNTLSAENSNLYAVDNQMACRRIDTNSQPWMFRFIEFITAYLRSYPRQEQNYSIVSRQRKTRKNSRQKEEVPQKVL
jgi:hypothetical protein